MGTQVKGICKCGHEQDSSVGGGKQNYKKVDYFPYLCVLCSEIITCNLKDKKRECLNCNSKGLVPYNDNSLIGEIGSTKIAQSFDNYLTDGFYKCPKCRKMRLRFIEGIMWD